MRMICEKNLLTVRNVTILGMINSILKSAAVNVLMFILGVLCGVGTINNCNRQQMKTIEQQSDAIMKRMERIHAMESRVSHNRYFIVYR